jgi:hypothetical protein
MFCFPSITCENIHGLFTQKKEKKKRKERIYKNELYIKSQTKKSLNIKFNFGLQPYWACLVLLLSLSIRRGNK